MRVLGIAGLSVTMPHKHDVAAAVDRLDPAAAALHSVNTVSWDGDELVGSSTDGAGFVASLAEAGVDVSGARVAVIGAGGAARSVIDALGRAGAASISVSTGPSNAPSRPAGSPRSAPSGSATTSPGPTWS
jgi:shikimate dehydrogenase